MNHNDNPGGVYRRCGCLDQATGRRLGTRCPRLADPAHGSWYYTAQVSDPGGRRHRQRRGGFATAATAGKARAHATVTDVTGGRGRRWTVAAWLRHWLDTLPGQVRPTTATAYQAHTVGCLIPYLGEHHLGRLRPAQIEAMLGDLYARPTRTGTPMPAATLHRIRATLRRALNLAIRDGLLTVNPARLVVLPHPQRHRPQPWTPTRIAAWQHDGTRPTVAVWTPTQLAQFLRTIHHDWLFPLWWLTALRGLRRGEVCGLRWIDVDLCTGMLSVAQQATRVPGRAARDSNPEPAD